MAKRGEALHACKEVGEQGLLLSSPPYQLLKSFLRQFLNREGDTVLRGRIRAAEGTRGIDVDRASDGFQGGDFDF